ncbi:unnamed protein product [Moneuplotes crassus]|uniref:PX domain-containing protein n=1 Tax=Euplotes crassus TaxID=5936 RepID=A0AAD1UPZ6_EUPCR|nr:unnamed protein product [Moneuplotes crassus]
MDIHPASRETQFMTSSDVSPSGNPPPGGYGSSDDDIEEVVDSGENNKFEFEVPYPDVQIEDSTWSVSQPTKMGHITYTVTGEDKDGPFEGSRRYKDFFSLRQALVKRWPGVYVPPIPPKQSVGNKKDKFIANRMYFLDIFMKKISKIPYLVQSEEFQRFSKPSGDITATFNTLGPISPQDLKERLENDLGVSSELDESVVNQSREQVNDFQSFLKKILPTLKALLEEAEKMVGAKENLNKRTGAIIDAMSFYESNGLSRFVDQDVTRMVVENPEDPEMKAKSDGIGKTFKNTFKDFYFWIRSSQMDVEAVIDAVSGRDKVVQNRVKLINKQKSEKNELDNINNKKKTLKSLFQSASSKQSRAVFLTTDIEKLENDAKELDVIIKMLNCYIAENIIPVFKEKQIKEYYEFLNFLARREINNSAATISFWSDFMKNENVSAASS